MSEGTSQKITLDYQRQGLERAAMPRWLRVGFAVGALPGLVVPWLLFAMDTSPWMVVRAFGTSGFNLFYNEVLLALVLPFFLALPIFGWKLRLAIGAKSRMWERVTVWTVGGLGLAATCFVLVQLAGHLNAEALPMFSGALVMLGAGIAAMVWLLRKRARAESVATLALCFPYLVNAVTCLLGFRDDMEIGWYVTFGVCGIMVIEVVWTVVWEIGIRANISEA